MSNAVRRWQESWLVRVSIRPVEVDPNGLQRIWGSSPWRRTRDQGSDLGFLAGPERFLCLSWTVVCSVCALEQKYDPAGWRTGRIRRRHDARVMGWTAAADLESSVRSR